MTRIMYVRNQDWEPVGCIVIRVDRLRQCTQYQFSVLNPKDKTSFNRKEAQRLALFKLVDKPFSVDIHRDAKQHDISMAIMRDIAGSKLPSRLVKFANLWIKKVQAQFLLETHAAQ